MPIVNLLQFLYYNFNTIVFQTVLSVDVLCGEERFVFNSISYRKMEEEEGGWGGGGGGKLKNTINLPVTLSFTGRWSHLLMSSCNQYH